MKVIHTADIHLGADPRTRSEWGIDRGKEIWNTFEALVGEAERIQADLLLIAGDLFHRQPLLRELKEVNSVFASLSRTKVICMAGNHDYIKCGSYYQSFSWAKNVYFFQHDRCEGVYIPELNTEVHGLSYHQYEIREPLYDGLELKNDGRIHILLAHGGDEKHIPFSKEVLAEKGFHYIALGHIHKPQIITGKMAYAGSLEPLDLTEEGPRGYIEARLDKKTTELSFVPFARRRYMPFTIKVDTSLTNAGLKRVTAELVKKQPEGIFLKICLEGFRDADIAYDTQSLYSLGHIALIEDRSRPDYDFGALEKMYKRSVIGTFIRSFLGRELSETEKKALYYGVRAMLDEMR